MSDNSEAAGSLMVSVSEWRSMLSALPDATAGSKEDIVRSCAYAECEATVFDGAQPGTCGTCGVAWYCGSQCQKLDWPKHKKVCESTRYEGQQIRSNVFTNNPELCVAAKMGVGPNCKNMQRKRLNALMLTLRQKVSMMPGHSTRSAAQNDESVNLLHAMACCALYLGDLPHAKTYLERGRRNHDLYLLHTRAAGPSHELYRDGWQALPLFQSYVQNGMAAAKANALYEIGEVGSSANRENGLCAIMFWEKQARVGQSMMSTLAHTNVVWDAHRMNQKWQVQFKEFRNVSMMLRNVLRVLALNGNVGNVVDDEHIALIIMQMKMHAALNRLELPRDPSSGWVGWETIERRCAYPLCTGNSTCVSAFCSGCGFAAYCGRDCQRADFANHKPLCKLVYMNGQCVSFYYGDPRIRAAQAADDLHGVVAQNASNAMTWLRKALYREIEQLQVCVVMSSAPISVYAAHTWKRVQAQLRVLVVNLHQAVPHQNVDTLLDEVHSRLNEFGKFYLLVENHTFNEMLGFYYMVKSVTDASKQLQVESLYWMREIRLTRVQWEMGQHSSQVGGVFFTVIKETLVLQTKLCAMHNMTCREFHAWWQLYYQARSMEILLEEEADEFRWPLEAERSEPERTEPRQPARDHFLPLLGDLLSRFMAKLEHKHDNWDLVKQDMNIKLMVVRFNADLPAQVVKFRTPDF